MTVNIEEMPEHYVVKLSDDFDSNLAEEARKEFKRITTPSTKNVILDLKNVEFIDSSGVGAIVFLYKRLRCEGFDLTISHPQEQPYELFKLLRIDKIIEVIS